MVQPKILTTFTHAMDVWINHPRKKMFHFQLLFSIDFWIRYSNIVIYTIFNFNCKPRKKEMNRMRKKVKEKLNFKYNHVGGNG